MHQRRVGTVSMGVLLLSMGVLLLYAQFNSIAAIDIINKWWPIVFVLLGGEIIAYTYLIKDAQQRIRYDFISILVVLFIVGAGTGLYCLSETGLIERAREAIASKHYTLQLPEEKVELDNTIRKLIMESPSHTKLTVRTSQENAASIQGTAYVSADSQENAQKLLLDKVVTTRRVGDTVYIAFNLPMSGGDLGYNARISEFTVFLPESRQVEINGDYQLDLIIYNLKNNWDVNANGDINLRLGSGLDLTVNSLVNNKRNLQGNVTWKIPEEEQVPEEEKEGNKRIVGSVTCGQGTNKINIISRGNVEVNQVQD